MLVPTDTTSVEIDGKVHSLFYASHLIDEGKYDWKELLASMDQDLREDIEDTYGLDEDTDTEDYMNYYYDYAMSCENIGKFGDLVLHTKNYKDKC